jgi:hypothetical protein
LHTLSVFGRKDIKYCRHAQPPAIENKVSRHLTAQHLLEKRQLIRRP